MLEKPCEKCKHILTCDCPYCERAFCAYWDVHIQDIDYNQIDCNECFEVCGE
jgi:hypothetical protein